MAATQLVTDVARRLAPSRIDVMPVKGALLQHWLYDDPADRPLTDVDILVRPEHLTKAISRLEIRGYRRFGRTGIGAVLMETPLGLMLDLHPRLFDRARYCLPTEALFARSSEDSELYGARVRLPSPLDIYAHLIGKFGSDHLDSRAAARLDEIARMSRRLDVPPETVARHLVRSGMRRVARYVLLLVHQTTGDLLAQRIYDRLPHDPIGSRITSFASFGLSRLDPNAASGALIAHLLNHSLLQGGRSGAHAVLHRLRGT